VCSSDLSAFKPPSLNEIIEYCSTRSSPVDPESFFAYYQSNGWVIGQSKAKMKCWQSAIITWEKRELKKPSNVQPNNQKSLSGQNRPKYELPQEAINQMKSVEGHRIL